MRRAALIVGLVLVAAGVDASAAMGQSCLRAGDTVIRNSVVRLYDDAAGRLYGCWLPSGRRVRLGAKLGRRRLADGEGGHAGGGVPRGGSPPGGDGLGRARRKARRR